MDRMGAHPGARDPGAKVHARSARRRRFAAFVVPRARTNASLAALVVSRESARSAARVGHPCDLPLQISWAISFSRALTSFAGIYSQARSCTPEAPRSFCETRAPRVFTDPALSPPEQLLWLTFFSGARRESSQKVVPGACSRIVCVGCRANHTSAKNTWQHTQKFRLIA